MFFNNSFILASSSKSMYKILKAVKLSFATKTPRCNEEQIKHKIKKSKFSPKKISEVLAKEKSKSISKLFKKKLVVGSDTVISFRQNIIDKAKNNKEAKNKILLLSGSTHKIYSSVSVHYNMTEVWKTTQVSLVKIRKLNEQEVDRYLSKFGKEVLTELLSYIFQLPPKVSAAIHDIIKTLWSFK